MRDDCDYSAARLYIGAGYAAYYQSGRAAREFRDKKQPE